jgi:hypothetical protein
VRVYLHRRERRAPALDTHAVQVVRAEGEGDAVSEITIARATSETARFALASFIDKHHSYIRWTQRPSRERYWSVFEDGERIGAFGLGSAFSWPGDVKRYMEARSLGFNEVANNIVYALAGHTDRNAGTKALSLLRHDAIRWWFDSYGDNLRAFQTFIAPPRTGAMYAADNWERIGETSGDGVETVTLSSDDAVPDGAVLREVDFGGVLRRTAQTRKDVTPKIIFMRSVTDRERRRAMRPPAKQTTLFGVTL